MPDGGARSRAEALHSRERAIQAGPDHFVGYSSAFHKI